MLAVELRTSPPTNSVCRAERRCNRRRPILLAKRLSRVAGTVPLRQRRGVNLRRQPSRSITRRRELLPMLNPRRKRSHSKVGVARRSKVTRTLATLRSSRVTDRVPHPINSAHLTD